MKAFWRRQFNIACLPQYYRCLKSNFDYFSFSYENCVCMYNMMKNTPSIMEYEITSLSIGRDINCKNDHNIELCSLILFTLKNFSE